jgi:hypothetical protein
MMLPLKPGTGRAGRGYFKILTDAGRLRSKVSKITLIIHKTIKITPDTYDTLQSVTSAANGF